MLDSVCGWHVPRRQTLPIQHLLEHDNNTGTESGLSDRTTESSTQPSTSAVIFEPETPTWTEPIIIWPSQASDVDRTSSSQQNQQLNLVGGCNALKSRDLKIGGYVRSPPPPDQGPHAALCRPWACILGPFQELVSGTQSGGIDSEPQTSVRVVCGSLAPPSDRTASY
jgi:hypothetical protein